MHSLFKELYSFQYKSKSENQTCFMNKHVIESNTNSYSLIVFTICRTSIPWCESTDSSPWPGYVRLQGPWWTQTPQRLTTADIVILWQYWSVFRSNIPWRECTDSSPWPGHVRSVLAASTVTLVDLVAPPQLTSWPYDNIGMFAGLISPGVSVPIAVPGQDMSAQYWPRLQWPWWT